MNNKSKKEKKKKLLKKASKENVSVMFLRKNFNIDLSILSGENVDINSLLDSDESTVDEDRRHLPKLLNAFGVIQSKAFKSFRRSETAYNIWKAMKQNSLRREYDRTGEKYTENKLSNDMRSDKEYKKLKNRIYDAEEKYGITKSIYWSLKLKVDLVEENYMQNRVNQSMDRK